MVAMRTSLGFFKWPWIIGHSRIVILILIHSKVDTPKEIFAFAKKFKKSKNYKPLVAEPSTYSKVNEKQLIDHGFKLVIYANHLLRAAYPAMEKVALNILKNLNLEKKNRTCLYSKR